jgi:hypothetical protein
MSGVIQGGWEYVVAAYVVSAGTLLAYGASIYLRWRAEAQRARQAAAPR